MRTESILQSTSANGTLIERHPVAAFAGFSIVFSWLPLIFATVLPYVPLVLVSAAAPLLAFYIVTRIRTEANDLHALMQLPSGIQWYVALIIPVLWGGLLATLHQLFPDSTVDYPIATI